MQKEKILQKNYEGLTPDESAKLIELERSVALDEARPNITKNFLSFVRLDILSRSLPHTYSRHG
jgi:hypothetical protein